MQDEYIACTTRTSSHYFGHILSQHAIVMIDAAAASDHAAFIRLGGRLHDVQSKWINLLCARGQSETLDNQYRRVVTRLIKTFTSRLMDAIVDNKFVSYEELASIGEMHSYVHSRAEQYLTQTRSLFEKYVIAVCLLHEKQTVGRQLNVMHLGYELGTWLDKTIL